MLEIKIKTGKTGWLGDILVSLSVANLMLFNSWVKLIYSDSYFLPTFRWYDYLSATVLLFLFATLFLLILRIFRTDKKTIWQLMLLMPFGVAFFIMVDAIRLSYFDFTVVFDNIFSQIIKYYPWVILIVTIIVFLLFLSRKKLIPAVYILLLIFSPFAFLNLFYIAVNTTSSLINYSSRFEKISLANDAITTPKIIYIIFDELDYEVFFKDKVDKIKNIDLKNLEYIKQNTLFFNNVKNMWDSTTRAIPAITTGEDITIRELTYPFPDIELTFADGEKTLWSKSDTIFSTMKSFDRNLAIIGFHHHYCEIFSHIATYCIAADTLNSFSESLKIQMVAMFPYYRRLQFIHLHQKIEKSTLDALSSNIIDFIYIHDSIPHVPAIWDAESSQYSLYNPVVKYERDHMKNYFYNVQLVDDFLGRIIRRMKEKEIWESSTIIIGSDHRWRKPYGRKPLENIPLLIKFPKQKTGYQYDKKILPTQIKAMIEQIAINKIHDPVAFMQWLDQQSP